MVALFTDAITAEPKAILRTAITPNGTKIGRLALDPIGGSVIRLWPTASHRLVIAEGIETALSVVDRYHYFAETNDVRAMRAEDYFPQIPPGEVLRPVWAAGGSNLTGFPVLPDISKLIILVDHDANEAGQKSALTCARRWQEAGRHVVRLVPREIDQDFADIEEAT